MPTDNPIIRRLARLEAFGRLSPAMKTAVRIHLTKDIPGEEAAALAGADNPSRSWKSPRVQACLLAFRGEPAEEKTVDQLVAEFEAADLETARAEWLKTPPERIGRTQPPPSDQREPISRPSEPIQETPIKPESIPLIPKERFSAVQQPRGSEVVLGGSENGISLGGLFPHLDNLNLQFWRQQREDEEAERRKLIAIIQQREERR